MIIDLYGLTADEVKHRYPAVYAWVLDNVKPQRDQSKRTTRKEKWWLFAEPAPGLRSSTHGLSRYIVTPQVSRRNMFVFLDASVLPDDKLITIGTDDAFYLGVLSSRIHETWKLATGARLGAGNDPVYNKTVCFEAFPFPDADDMQIQQIRDIGETIDHHRKERQSLYPRLAFTDMYSVIEKMRYGVHLTDKEARIQEQGDLTTLKQLHDVLDGAVADAYGWPHNLPKDEILARLVVLHRQRVEEEQGGVVRWLRPDYQQ